MILVEPHPVIHGAGTSVVVPSKCRPTVSSGLQRTNSIVRTIELSAQSSVVSVVWTSAVNSQLMTLIEATDRSKRVLTITIPFGAFQLMAGITINFM